MKVLQIIQRPQLRGAEIFAGQLSEELQRKGITVDVVYLFDSSSYNFNFNLRIIPLNGNSSKRFHDFAAYKRLSTIITEGNYDLVQANAGDTLKYAALSKLLYRWKAPLVFRNASKMGDFMKNALHVFLNRVFLRQCNYVISVSENCRQDLINLFPHTKECSRTITIGTYLTDHIQTTAISGVEEEPLLINIGSFVPEKNHSFLIKVFDKFYTKYKKGYLILVGDGFLRTKLEAAVQSRSLTERILFLGYRKDVVSILKSCDIMVMPSKIEGLPGVILESLASGVPVIASNVGGIPEVLKDGIGISIRGWSVDSYVSSIEELLHDSNKRQLLADAGRNLIIKQYLMPDIAEQFLRTYNELLISKKNDSK